MISEVIKYVPGPMVVKDKPIVFFDVDDTLVLWNQHVTEENEHLIVEDIYELVLKHEPHVEKVKEFKLRGHTVVVWSQGGSEWAEKVVNALGLRQFVDIIMPKPYWFFDDLPASAFMDESKRTWKSPFPVKKSIDPINDKELDNEE